MTREVTVRGREDAPVELPQVCCYCLAPASDAVRIKLPHRRRKTGIGRTPTRPYHIAAPYCAEHGPLARRLERYAGRVSVGLLALGVAAAAAFDFTAGFGLREVGSGVWLATSLLVWTGIAALAIAAYRQIMRLLRRRHPELADYFYTGCLGIDAQIRNTTESADSGVQIVEVMLAFSNHDYARRVAQQHGVSLYAPERQSDSHPPGGRGGVR